MSKENNKGENEKSNEILSSLKIIQKTLATSSENANQSRIPSRLVLTPETDPLHPPGYGYPVLPGLKRLQPKRPKNSTKTETRIGPSPADQEERISKYAMYYCYLALATFVCSYGQMLCWSISELSCFRANQYERVRQEDVVEDGKGDGDGKRKGEEEQEEEEEEEGFGARITVIIQNVANFASSMLVSFIQNWQLTLMMLVAGPVIASVMFYMNKLKSIALEKVKLLMQKARGVAKGAFSQVQTVAAFGGQDYEKKKFASNLLAADKAAKVRSLVDAIRAGIMIVIAFVFLGIGFWFSSILILNGTLTPGAFISIFMAIISSVLKLVNVGGAVGVDEGKDEKDDKSMLSSDNEEENQRPNVIGRILEHLSSPEELFKYYPNRPEAMLKGGNRYQCNDELIVQFCGGKNDPDRNNMTTSGAKSFLETKILSQVKKRGLSLEAVKLQIQQLPLIILSLVGAVMTGMIAPGFSLLLSEILIVTADPKRLKSERYKWAFKFVDLGIFIAIGSSVQKFSTSLSESRVEMGLKGNAFNSTMDKSEAPKTSSEDLEISADEERLKSRSEVSKTSTEQVLAPKEKENLEINVKELSQPQKLSKEPDMKTNLKRTSPNPISEDSQDLNLIDEPSSAKAESMTTKMDKSSMKNSFSLSSLTANVSSNISTFMTMFIAFTNGWKMTLVVLAGQPIISYAKSVQNDDDTTDETKDEESDGIISKVWKKVRGVTTSAAGKIPANNNASKFKDECLKPYKYAVKMLIATGLAFAIAECVTFLVYAGALRYGGYLVRVGEMTVESVMTVLMTVLFGGAGSSNAPEEKSKTKKESPETEESGDVKADGNDNLPKEKVKPNDVNGEMEFHEVEIHHPEKKNVILSGLNISVKPSETLAIVGTTDFNSNAVLALVERFYDPSSGCVTLDGLDIRDMDPRWLRSQIALVSETSVLSHHSIADNLMIADTAGCLSYDYLEDVARKTRLHEDVENFPTLVYFNSLVFLAI
ncbi:multidrug resistance protein 1-like [Dendronephthya gigantea]|uniref:multidrug resistance protein 1-like n=1 Tax=Dendronephthya gigantea TaxID=151771 RepID=UPI001069E163|nr:multidrug resistance protein 1-like [Dendronephthya gigantea]